VKALHNYRLDERKYYGFSIDLILLGAVMPVLLIHLMLVYFLLECFIMEVERIFT
jgi:hypothetical protein